jgi:hypothetical protein
MDSKTVAENEFVKIIEKDIKERPYIYFNTHENPDYNDFMTSRNTYYRGK